jgi:hypothetical protein
MSRLASRMPLSLVLVLAACAGGDATSPDLSGNAGEATKTSMARGATPAFTCLVDLGGPYEVSLSWSRAPVGRTWITSASPTAPGATELFDVYDDHTLDRAKRKGKYVVTIAELPTAAIFFDEDNVSIGRVGCERVPL